MKYNRNDNKFWGTSVERLSVVLPDDRFTETAKFYEYDTMVEYITDGFSWFVVDTNVGYNTYSVSKDITFSSTRPDDTTAYGINDVVGNYVFSGISLDSQSENIINNASLEIDVNAVPSGMGGFRLHLYNAVPTAIADNAAFNIITADATKHLGWVDFDTPEDVGDRLKIQMKSINFRFELSNVTTLYGVLVTKAGWTPAALKTIKILLNVTSTVKNKSSIVDDNYTFLKLDEDLLTRSLASTSGANLLLRPTELNLTIPPVIYQNGSEYTTSFDITTKKAPAGVTYYVSNSGSDSNDGLTVGAPLKYIATAIAKADVGTIILADGDYLYRTSILATGTNFLTIAKSVNLMATTNGAVNLMLGQPATVLTFSKTGGKTNVYERTFSDIATYVYIIDLTRPKVNGKHVEFKTVGSIEEVDFTQNSIYFDGNTIYIHCTASRAPDVDLIVGFNSYGIDVVSTNDFTVYFEGINIYGSLYCVKVNANKAANASFFSAKDCKFLFAALDQSCASFYGPTVYLQNCEGAYALRGDGFSYGESSVTGIPTKAVEINCIGHHNGTNSAINNGSTLHAGAQIIRLNCAYWKNAGHNLADTQSAVAWNLGCIATESLLGVDVKSYDNAVDILQGCIIVDSTKIVEGAPESGYTTDTGTITQIDSITNVVKIEDGYYKYK